MTKKAEPKKNGRPTKYTQELADEILLEIETTPRGLDEICRSNSHFPPPSTIYRWMDAQAGFRERYIESKKRQAQTYVDRVTTDLYKEYDQPHQVSQLKIQADFIKWYAGRLVPKLYGDKAAVEDKQDAAIIRDTKEKLERALEALKKDD